MIILHQFPPAAGLPNISPFSLKLETWLRIAGLEYQTVSTPNPRSAPLGKLPYIELEGRKIADSALCIAALSEKFAIDLDRHLSAEQRAVADAFGHLLEDHFYYALVYSRWIDPEYWPEAKRIFFGALPPPLNRLVPVLARSQIRRDLHGQGLSRHRPEQIYDFAEQDLASVSAWLADKPYFMGDTVSSIDATVFGFLAQATLVRMASPLPAIAANYPNLKAYCERLRTRYFG